MLDSSDEFEDIFEEYGNDSGQSRQGVYALTLPLRGYGFSGSERGGGF